MQASSRSPVNVSDSQQARISPPERSRYARASRRDQFIVQLIARAVEEHITVWSKLPEPTKRILDVGCGNQPFRGLFESNGFTYLGLDVSPQTLVKPDFLGSIDGSLPEELVRSGPFDFILCTEVLEHVLDWRQAFKNLASLLRSNGRLLITAPFHFPLHEEPFDFWRPTPHAIQAIANESGFMTLSLTKHGGSREVLGQLLVDVLASWYVKSEQKKRGLLYTPFRKASRFMTRNLLTLLLILTERLPEGILPPLSSSYLSNIGEFRKK